MTNLIRRFVKEEDGVTFVEYALIVAVMVLVAFSAWGALGDNVQARIQEVADALN